MSRAKSLLLQSLAVVGMSGPAAAQSLDGRHQIELRIGAWNQFTDARTETSTGGVSTTVGGSGFIGGIAYGHWLKERLALRVSVGALLASVDTDIGTGGISTKTAVVSPILLGMKFYFPRSTYGSSVRPFVGAGAGPFVGSQTETRAGTTVSVASRTEAALGSELQAGADFLLGRHLMLSAALGAHLMTDFSKPIGGSRNYSGPQLSLGLSLLLGGGSGGS